MIIEMRMLRLVEDCIIFRGYDRTKGDYSKSAQFQNAAWRCNGRKGMKFLQHKKFN